MPQLTKSGSAQPPAPGLLIGAHILAFFLSLIDSRCILTLAMALGTVSLMSRGMCSALDAASM